MSEKQRVLDVNAPISHADEQYREQIFTARQYSYDLVQRLTYFVVSVELVTCGYILLNAGNLVAIDYLNYLFLLCGLSAIAGILWRFFYNITYHNNTHGINDCTHKIAKKLQIVIYYFYVILTIASFAWLLILGFIYLTSLSIGS